MTRKSKKVTYFETYWKKNHHLNGKEARKEDNGESLVVKSKRLKPGEQYLWNKKLCTTILLLERNARAPLPLPKIKNSKISKYFLHETKIWSMQKKEQGRMVFSANSKIELRLYPSSGLFLCSEKWKWTFWLIILIMITYQNTQKWYAARPQWSSRCSNRARLEPRSTRIKDVTTQRILFL